MKPTLTEKQAYAVIKRIVSKGEKVLLSQPNAELIRSLLKEQGRKSYMEYDFINHLFEIITE
jgi:hypothetical protein